MKVLFTFVLAGLLVGTTLVSAEVDIRQEQIQFKKGISSATITGKIKGARPSIIPDVRQDARLTTDPIDKSIPAVRIAKVCPTLTNPSGTTCRKRFWILREVRNISDRKLVAMIKPTNTR